MYLSLLYFLRFIFYIVSSLGNPEPYCSFSAILTSRVIIFKIGTFWSHSKVIKTYLCTVHTHVWNFYYIEPAVFFSMHAESIWKCDPYVPTPLVHALLDQASKNTQVLSILQSVSRILSAFEMYSPFEFQGKSRNTLLFLPFFIGWVPGERFVKAYKIKSTGASTFIICVDGLNFFCWNRQI